MDRDKREKSSTSAMGATTSAPRQQAVRQILKAGLLYFLLVFAAGFVLGTIRVLWIVPHVGTRMAELLEAPVMLAVTVLAARYAVRRVSLRCTSSRLLSVGFVALTLLLGAEITVVVLVRHLTLEEYFASRDAVAGMVYVVMLSLFAVMPLMVARRYGRESIESSALLDPFIPRPDIRERHQIRIHAPAGLVFEAARNLDIQSPPIIRGIFWLRAKVLGAKMHPVRPAAGLIAEMLGIGWGRLAEDANHFFVAGAVCQPWQADVVFSPIPPDEFAAFAEPGRVKIAWTLETETLGPALTRFATETRALATDYESRIKFRRYWRTFGIGVLLIRRLLLAAVRRDAERLWRAAARTSLRVERPS
jgi:hypothetical protein